MDKSYEITPEDIEKFDKAVKRLNKLLMDIRKYCPSAHLWITPSTVNLMAGYGSCVGKGKLEKEGDEHVVAEATILNMDVGDW
jgi:hypothetical protein